MKLFTKDIDKKLFAQYSKGADLENQKVVAKIFNPYGRGRWYLLNSDPNDPDYIWAIVQMDDDIDVGSVSRRELENIKVPPFRLGLERDIYFSEVNAAELFKGLFSGKFYKSGGEVDIAEQNKDMLINYAEELEHHTEEFEEAAKKAENVEPWVVAKIERSTTDLSDVTHYLDSENEKRREYVDGEGEEMAKGGRLMGKGDAVIYDDETHYITEKNGVVGLVNMKQGAWGSNFPFIPLSKIDVSKEVTDMYGEKVKIPTRFESGGMAVGEFKVEAKLLEEDFNRIKDSSLFKNSRLFLYDNTNSKEFKISISGSQTFYDPSNQEYKVVGKYSSAKELVEDLNKIPNKNYSYRVFTSVIEFDEDISRLELYDDATAVEEIEFTLIPIRKLNYDDGGELDYIIKDGSDKYYSRGISSGNVKWNDSQDMAYMFKKEEADEIKSKLESQGYKDLTIQKYDKDWWKKMADGGSVDAPSNYIKKFQLNSEGNFAAEIGGVKYEIIYRDDKTQLYDLFKNGKKIKSSKSIRDLMKSDIYAKGGVMSDSEYKKRIKKFGFKPYGKTKGIYTVTYIADGKNQSEKHESKEMALSAAKRYSSPQLADEFSDVKVFDEEGKEIKMAKGGVTFADKVKAVKSSLLKRKKVSPKVQKDYGKTYSPAEAEDSAKRIVGAMTAKERLMKRVKKGKK
jgi:hypothetical protein